MEVREYCTSEVCTISPKASAREAAERMYAKAVGALVVVDGEGRVEGIVTDRDLCIRAVAAADMGGGATVHSVMSSPVETVSPDDSIDEAVRRMRTLGVRRMPVRGPEGLEGILALDDVLDVLTRALRDLAVETRLSQQRSEREARQQAVVDELESLYEQVRDRVRSANWQARETFLHDVDVVKGALRRALGLKED